MTFNRRSKVDRRYRGGSKNEARIPGPITMVASSNPARTHRLGLDKSKVFVMYLPIVFIGQWWTRVESNHQPVD
jgi:hypothetical protein